MSDEDELTDDSNEIDSSDEPLDTSDDDLAEADAVEVSETEEIPTMEDSMSHDDDSSAMENGVTQAEVYENLKRIGELEDEKRNIQEEIWNRTEQLRSVVNQIDQNSILYKILESALANSAPRGESPSGGKKAAAKGAPKAATKPAKKKTRRK